MKWAAFGFVLLAGCGTTCPQVKATRCSGSTVELCGSNKKWQRVMDCAQIKPISAGAPARWACIAGRCAPEKGVR